MCVHFFVQITQNNSKYQVFEKRVAENVRMKHQFYIQCHSFSIEVLYIPFKFKSNLLYILVFTLNHFITTFEITISIEEIDTQKN